jgi:hypothetical protein
MIVQHDLAKREGGYEVPSKRANGPRSSSASGPAMACRALA